MNHLIAIVCFVLCFTSFSHAEKVCPESQEVYPCECLLDGEDFLPGTIVCNNYDQPLDLKKIFKRLSDSSSTPKSYVSLIIEDVPIKEIPEDVLANITFRESIRLQVPRLTRIHSRAFRSSAKTLKALMVGNPNPFEANEKLKDYPDSPYSIYDLVNTFEKLIYLELNAGIEHVANFSLYPNIAHVEQMKLAFFGNHTKRDVLGQNKFSNLENVFQLYLGYSSITYVPKNAFHFAKKSNTSIAIALSHNQLNGSSFAVGAFENINRPATLWFGANNISYVEEKVFAPFLDAHPKNQALLPDPIDCTDCRNYWILKKKAQTNNRLQFLSCVNVKDGRKDKQIWRNEDMFKHCEK